MTDIHELSNTELAKALRCCSVAKVGCFGCPANKLRKTIDCTDEICLEAAERIEGITSIQAARDAMAKELKKLGVVL